MNAEDTANAYEAWSPGMAVTLTLFKKLPTPDGATSDPYAAPIVLTACRKRGLTSAMMLAYGPVIGVGRSRLFEIWPGADGEPTDIVANGDVVQEDGGAVAVAWDGVTAFVAGDLVTSGGTYYLCVLANTNHTPSNATYWTPAPRWVVKAKPETIFDNATLALCIPE